MLADDTTIHTSAKTVGSLQENLQKNLDQIYNWCRHNAMIINPLKTKSMIITTRQKHQLCPINLNLNVNGKNIEQVVEFNYQEKV